MRDGHQGASISTEERTKKKMKLNRVGKVWVLDCTVTSEFISELSSVSVGQVCELKFITYKSS